MNPAKAIILYREALGRARNVVCDLEDFEWINQSDDGATARLGEIANEAGRVTSLLQVLHIESQKSEGT